VRFICYLFLAEIFLDLFIFENLIYFYFSTEKLKPVLFDQFVRFSMCFCRKRYTVFMFWLLIRMLKSSLNKLAVPGVSIFFIAISFIDSRNIVTTDEDP